MDIYELLDSLGLPLEDPIVDENTKTYLVESFSVSELTRQLLKHPLTRDRIVNLGTNSISFSYVNFKTGNEVLVIEITGGTITKVVIKSIGKELITKLGESFTL